VADRAAVLTGVLSDLLDIDLQDAAIIALATGVLRGVMWVVVFYAMLTE